MAKEEKPAAEPKVEAASPVAVVTEAAKIGTSIGTVKERLERLVELCSLVTRKIETVSDDAVRTHFTPEALRAIEASTDKINALCDELIGVAEPQIQRMNTFLKTPAAVAPQIQVRAPVTTKGQ